MPGRSPTSLQERSVRRPCAEAPQFPIQFVCELKRSDRIAMRKSPGGVLSSPYQTTRGLLEIPPYFEVQREFRGQFPSSGSVGSHKPLAQTPVKFGPVRARKLAIKSLPV